MDYKDLYEQLIQLRKTEQLVKSKEQAGMIESHHILPRCCGGTDDPNNIVNLYAKEHFMAHYYLWKMRENDEFKYPLLNAFWMMCIMGSTFQDRSYQEYVKMSDEYQEARIQFAKQLSDTMSDKVSGSKNGQFGKHWYYNPLTNESHQYVDGQQPNGWILGRKYKDRDAFANAVSKVNKNTCWIYSIDLTMQKRVDKKIAEDLIATGKWKYGHLKYSDESKLKCKLSKCSEKKKRYPKCLNCGKDNPNIFAICCCDNCKKEYVNKHTLEKINEKRKIEVQQIEQTQQFRAQITERYRGVIDRKQVRRYLEFKGNHSCNCCGKENVKLIVHAIDGNCRNLSIDNYEFLCHECYINSGTNGFSGHSMKEINKQRKLKK